MAEDVTLAIVVLRARADACVDASYAGDLRAAADRMEARLRAWCERRRGARK